ncbi:MAG: hypothetical protein VB013_03900 [Anaerolineaceae bacterium]|nr:hypothetical protein [Anaerolineaceae bacterium]
MNGFEKFSKLDELNLRNSEPELRGVANILLEDDPSQKSQVKAKLKQTLLERQQLHLGSKSIEVNQPAKLFVCSKLHWGLTAITILTVLFLLMTTVPEVKAFTDGFITRIGNLIFKEGPTDAQVYVATMQSGTPTATFDPNKKCTSCPTPQVVGLLSVAEVSKQAGYTVLEAQYIPQGYQISGRDVLFTDKTITVDTSYRMELDPPLHDGQQMTAILSITQTRFVDKNYDWESNTGEVPVVEVSVRDNPGVWLEQIPIYPFQNESGDWQYAYWNQLIWSENGFNFVVQTNLPSSMLSLKELQKIADSMQ